MLNLFKGKEFAAPAERPGNNIGCLTDIPTGTYVKGVRGENVLTGGRMSIDSFTGGGNMFKSDFLLFPIFRCLERYPSHRAIIYDTEMSLKYQRFYRIASQMPSIADYDWKTGSVSQDPLLLLLQKCDVPGEQFFEMIKDLGEEKRKHAKQLMQTLPIYDLDGVTPIRILAPTHIGIDSISKFSSSKQDEAVEKNEVGDKDNNTMYMRDGNVKTQLIDQLPKLAANGGLRFTLVAHIGMVIEINGYAPKAVELTFAKNGHKKKGVPPSFSYINEHLIEVVNSKPLHKDGIPFYPSKKTDREKGNDLFVVTGVSSRNKGGPSGIFYPFVISQNEGILVGLTEYAYIKENDKYGLQGNNTTFQLCLVPDVNMMRTTVREISATNPKVQRALEITSEMCQMERIWRREGGLHIPPSELYENLKAKGYDWDMLLDTRGYYMAKEDEVGQKPFLSTMDLLEMAAGTYHPYWLKEDKQTIKKDHWKIGW